MNVVTLVDFHDNLKDVDRKRGEQFVVSRERFEEINAVGMSKIGKPIVEERPTGRRSSRTSKKGR